MRQPDLEARAGADGVARAIGGRAIGGRVRQGRNSRGWTLISDALGIGLPALVDMDDPPGLRVTRAGREALQRGTRSGNPRAAPGP